MTATSIENTIAQPVLLDVENGADSQFNPWLEGHPGMAYLASENVWDSAYPEEGHTSDPATQRDIGAAATQEPGGYPRNFNCMQPALLEVEDSVYAFDPTRFNAKSQRYNLKGMSREERALLVQKLQHYAAALVLSKARSSNDLDVPKDLRLATSDDAYSEVRFITLDDAYKALERSASTKRPGIKELVGGVGLAGLNIMGSFINTGTGNRFDKVYGPGALHSALGIVNEHRGAPITVPVVHEQVIRDITRRNTEPLVDYTLADFYEAWADLFRPGLDEEQLRDAYNLLFNTDTHDESVVCAMYLKAEYRKLAMADPDEARHIIDVIEARRLLGKRGLAARIAEMRNIREREAWLNDRRTITQARVGKGVLQIFRERASKGSPDAWLLDRAA